MAEPKVSACPYAQTKKQSDDDLQFSTEDPAGKETATALELAKSNCPAFKSGCPFRDAKTDGAVRKLMMNIPKSHLEIDISKRSSIVSDTSSTVLSEDDDTRSDLDDNASTGSSSVGAQFRLAVEHLHTVSQSLHSENDNENSPYSLNECPFKSYYHADDLKFVSFFKEIKHKDNKSEAKLHEAPEVERDSLSVALKKGTQEAHKAAENVHFVRNFIKGKIDRDFYSIFIKDLYFVYKNLEILLEKYAPQYFPTLHFPLLNRTSSLEQDLCYFHGDDWEAKVTPSAATRDYMKRMDEVAANDPLLLLAHAYTRYLGDLSGGRVLQRVARRAMQLPKYDKENPCQDGLRFYDFEEIESPKEFKNAYRQALDELVLDVVQVKKLVGEANVAFVLNMRLFEELDVMAGEPGARVRSLSEALAFFNIVSDDANHDNAQASQKCPFLVEKAAKKSTNELHGKKSSNHTSTTTVVEKGRCPWPFVFLHDPMQGMRDYQTWVVLALVCSYMYNRYLNSSVVY